MKRLITICAIAAVILTATDPAQAATLNVPSTAYPTIQAAIDASINGDKVVVADGTYTGTGNHDIDFLGKAITLRSAKGPENCIIDCQGSKKNEHRGFYFHSGEKSSAVLDGFTIKNGYKYPGAGIYCSGSSPIIKNCKITKNKAEWLNGTGGGCYFSNSFAKIINCRITFNSAIGTSTHSGNGWGGGIGIAKNSKIAISDSQIMNNYATYFSGGVGVNSSSLSVVNSVISNNSSESGAGLHFQDSSPTIMNSTITKNSAKNNGGGFYCIRSKVTVVNTILWGDTGGEIDGWGSKITVTYSDVQGGWKGKGNIHADPLFVNAPNGDYHLQSGSPCIDAGTNTAVTSGTDLDGNPRIVNDIVDMGAFEANPIVALANKVIDLDLPNGISNSLLVKLDPAQAATLNVPSTAYPTIQAAIDASINGDKVVVADGTYTGTGNHDIDFLGKAITLRSKKGPEKCIIDCQGSKKNEHRGFYFHSGEKSSAMLDGFTITRGNISRGGGIYCINSSPTITNNIITGNSASGGGIYCDNSSPTITNNMIKQNVNSGQGGGIWCWDNSHPNIIGNIIIGNSSSYGGGINCNSNCSPIIKNNIIAGNSTDVQGGGIYCGISSPSIINNTITANSAQWGGGIYSGGSSSSPTIVNSILRNNSPQEVYLIRGGSITITYSCVQGGWPGAGNIDADPFFVDAPNGDYHLLLDSPCIDAGDNTAVTSGTDLDGNPRIVNDIVDMGAFEAGPIVVLGNTVIDLDLPKGIENSLLAKLDAAQKANDSVAINLLQAFIRTVEAQRGKQIPEADADTLIAAAEAIIAML